MMSLAVDVFIIKFIRVVFNMTDLCEVRTAHLTKMNNNVNFSLNAFIC